MSEIYEPEERFVERLEWQLSSEFRRKNRLRYPSGKIAVPRRMVAMVCIVARLPAGYPLPRGERDAGAGDLPRRGQGGPGRRPRAPGGDDPPRRLRERAKAAAGAAGRHARTQPSG